MSFPVVKGTIGYYDGVERYLRFFGGASIFMGALALLGGLIMVVQLAYDTGRFPTFWAAVTFISFFELLAFATILYAFSDIVQLLKKQNGWHYDDTISGKPRKGYKCSNCDAVVFTNYKKCAHCREGLDWSEIYEKKEKIS